MTTDDTSYDISAIIIIINYLIFLQSNIRRNLTVIEKNILP